MSVFITRQPNLPVFGDQKLQLKSDREILGGEGPVRIAFYGKIGLGREFAAAVPAAGAGESFSPASASGGLRGAGARGGDRLAGGEAPPPGHRLS